MKRRLSNIIIIVYTRVPDVITHKILFITVVMNIERVVISKLYRGYVLSDGRNCNITTKKYKNRVNYYNL